MKTMTCKQLAGACDLEFIAETFEEIGEMSKKHAIEMATKGDKAHIEKINQMMELMKEPGAAEKWLMKVNQEFNDLPNDN
jgi:hypothetical protein